MYIVKIQGTTKIPDFIQIRDDDFTLIAYFRINNPRRALMRCRLIDREKEIIELARKLPYGKIQKLEFQP
ncbi:MAG: fructose-6-phosphate aldolase [Bacteroidetes bacterium]|nr:MAG: fructose-6-phosphate aldolase [Bacteroidota bacterium]